MGLDLKELGVLQDSLARERRSMELVRLLSLWLGRFVPWAVPLLAVPLIARIMALPSWPGIVLFGAVAMASLLRVRTADLSWRIPAWMPLAIADHRSGARGALLHAVEGDGDVAAVPASALEVTLGPVSWRRSVGGLVAIGAAAVLTMVIPVPRHASQLTGRPRPAPVARVQALVQELGRQAPDDPFVAEAQVTLDRLAAEREGLSSEDFEALERMESDAVLRLSEEISRAELSQSLLSSLAPMLEQEGAQPGDLSRRMGEMARAAEAEGVDAETRSLIRRAEAELGNTGPDSAQQENGQEAGGRGRREASSQGERGEGGQAGEASSQGERGEGGQAGEASSQGERGEGGQPGETIGQGSSGASLRDQVERRRQELSAQIAARENALEETGHGGVARGPGVAPREFRHKTEIANAGFKNQPILDRKGGKVVALRRQPLPAAPASVQDRHEYGHGDPAASTFDSPTWDRRLQPRQRRVLRAYFGTDR